MKIHRLKTDPKPFEASHCGVKPWEIRIDDRNYRVGDTVILQETRYTAIQMNCHGLPLEYTGREIEGTISWVHALEDDRVIFTLEPAYRPMLDEMRDKLALIFAERGARPTRCFELANAAMEHRNPPPEPTPEQIQQALLNTCERRAGAAASLPDVFEEGYRAGWKARRGVL